MRRFGKILGRVLLWGGVFLATLIVLGPVEPVDRVIAFDPASLPEDLDVYLAQSEAALPDIVPNTQKQIIWNGPVGQKTPLAVVYLHGFSATLHEIRPVPDDVARALGANLYYTRLTGHGRGAAAMAEPMAGDWIEDTAEALAIGRRIGERVLVISTSTGGTLAAIAATDPDLSQGIAGIVFVSPNFGIDVRASFLLGLPYVRQWGPLVAGQNRSFPPRNELHDRYWTNSYPTVSAVPMEALVRHAVEQDFSTVKTPALFLYSPQDQVVQPAVTARIYGEWSAAKEAHHPVLGEGDDPNGHLITGDIMSPGQTAQTVTWIIDWAKGL
jgi:esterase/lipase